jgi:hypothetical protein
MTILPPPFPRQRFPPVLTPPAHRASAVTALWSARGSGRFHRIGTLKQVPDPRGTLSTSGEPAWRKTLHLPELQPDVQDGGSPGQASVRRPRRQEEAQGHDGEGREQEEDDSTQRNPDGACQGDGARRANWILISSGRWAGCKPREVRSLRTEIGAWRRGSFSSGRPEDPRLGALNVTAPRGSDVAPVPSRISRKE